MDPDQVMETLNRYIRPQTFPLALKLCPSQGDLPEKTRMPARDLGYQVTLCQGMGIARRYGWTLAIGKEDQCCIGGAAAMGFVSEWGGVSPVKTLEAGRYTHLLVAPLHSATFEADMVVLYVNPAQAMRLVQASSSALGQSTAAGEGVSAIATGTMDCGDIVARTTRSNECQFVLPSGGDRVFAGTQDDEVIFTIPRGKVNLMLQGLDDTHRTGFRYPILTDLRHHPNLPPFLQMPKAE